MLEPLSWHGLVFTDSLLLAEDTNQRESFLRECLVEGVISVNSRTHWQIWKQTSSVSQGELPWNLSFPSRRSSLWILEATRGYSHSLPNTKVSRCCMASMPRSWPARAAIDPMIYPWCDQYHQDVTTQKRTETNCCKGNTKHGCSENHCHNRIHLDIVRSNLQNYVHYTVRNEAHGVVRVDSWGGCSFSVTSWMDVPVAWKLKLTTESSIQHTVCTCSQKTNSMFQGLQLSLL